MNSAQIKEGMLDHQHGGVGIRSMGLWEIELSQIFIWLLI